MKSRPNYSRLAAKLLIRQQQGIRHANALADQVDVIMQTWFNNLVRYLQVNGGGHHFPIQLPATLIKDLSQGMARMAYWGHETAVAPLRDELPKRWMQAHAARITTTEARIMEDTGSLDVPGQDIPEPATAIDKDEMWELLKRWIFPPPDVHALSQIIFGGSNWSERIASLTSLAQPHVVAKAMVTGYAAGEDLQQLAKRLLPELNGVRKAARRVARTEGIRIAHQVQELAWHKLGPLKVGYQVHSAFSQHTRPWHAFRSGTIYYDQPEGDQKGPEQCPHPPHEAADVSERPPNTPKTAFN